MAPSSRVGPSGLQKLYSTKGNSRLNRTIGVGRRGARGNGGTVADGELYDGKDLTYQRDVVQLTEGQQFEIRAKLAGYEKLSNDILRELNTTVEQAEITEGQEIALRQLAKLAGQVLLQVETCPSCAQGFLGVMTESADLSTRKNGNTAVEVVNEAMENRGIRRRVLENPQCKKYNKLFSLSL